MKQGSKSQYHQNANSTKHMTMYRPFLITSLLLLNLLCLKVQAQRSVEHLSFNDFMQHVLVNNLELIIEQYEVSAAEAALIASRVFEDPELEMIFPTFDEDEFGEFPRNIAFEVEVPVDLFGKRRNRVRQAQAEKYAAEAGLEDFMRYLRADAATAFIDILTHQRIIQRMELTLEQLEQLTDLNQALFEAGEAGEIDVLQTRLEAKNFQAELYDIRSDFAELLTGVYFLMGGIPADSIVFVGELEASAPPQSFEMLREKALEQRPDIVMARHHLEASHYAMREVRAERFPDISLIAGYHNEAALSPGPGFKAAYGGLIIPLKFSGLNRGAYRESQSYFEQAGVMLDALSLEVETALRASWDRYLLMTRKRMLFTEGILQDAERVRDAISFSYQRGEVSLLEVLDAQRTMNEVYMNYYETLAQYAQSVVDLSHSSGEWFVSFE